MKAHLDAIRARMAVAFPVDLWVAESGRAGQYAIIEAPAWADDPDVSLCDSRSAFQTDVRVKAVAPTANGVVVMLTNARTRLPGVLDVPGRVASLRWMRSEFVGVDDSVTDSTGRHPAFGVDTFQLTSQPKE